MNAIEIYDDIYIELFSISTLKCYNNMIHTCKWYINSSLSFSSKSSSLLFSVNFSLSSFIRDKLFFNSDFNVISSLVSWMRSFKAIDKDKNEDSSVSPFISCLKTFSTYSLNEILYFTIENSS